MNAFLWRSSKRISQHWTSIETMSQISMARFGYQSNCNSGSSNGITPTCNMLESRIQSTQLARHLCGRDYQQWLKSTLKPATAANTTSNRTKRHMARCFLFEPYITKIHGKRSMSLVRSLENLLSEPRNESDFHSWHQSSLNGRHLHWTEQVFLHQNSRIHCQRHSLWQELAMLLSATKRVRTRQWQQVYGHQISRDSCQLRHQKQANNS